MYVHNTYYIYAYKIWMEIHLEKFRTQAKIHKSQMDAKVIAIVLFTEKETTMLFVIHSLFISYILYYYTYI